VVARVAVRNNTELRIERVVLQRFNLENPSKTKHEESTQLPCLDRGSTPRSSTKLCTLSE